MGVILLLAVTVFLVYAMSIKPRLIVGTISSRLSEGDQLCNSLNCQEVVNLLQAATWIRDKKEVKMGEAGTDDNSELVEVVCKGVTYRVCIATNDDSSSKLTVSVAFQSGSWDIERVRRFQEANRIRCRIVERANPNFTEQSSQYYGQIKTMYFMRYCAIALMASVICYASVPELVKWIMGTDTINELYTLGMAIATLLFVIFGITLSPYILVTRSEKLLDGFSVPQYLDNEVLMELLREKLHIRTLKSLYFDETGRVTIKGKCGTYRIEIFSERPRLSVAVQGSDKAEAYQEADYIQCSIMKLFNSVHPENPEKIYTTLMTIRRGNLLKGISMLAFVVLLAAPFLLNNFGSNGIANSYLTQYSETVTVGDAFEAFFGTPKWESYKIGSQKYVDFTGECTYMGDDATMRITFAVFDDRFNVSNIAVNGVDMSSLLWPGFLEAIYSGTQDPLPDDSEPTRTLPSEEPTTSPSESTIGLFDEFIGTWGDDSVDESFHPIAIGYVGDSKQQAYVKVSTAAALFITKLSLSDSNTAIGTIMPQDGEPGFEVTLHKNGTMLEATVYYGNIDLYFDNMDSYQHYNLTLVDPNNPDIDIDQPPMYPEPDLSSQEINKYDQYNLYVYEGDFSDINESVHLLLSVQPNGVEFDCQLFWMHGKFLESGTVCPGVQTPLSGGTLITLDLETNGDIHVLLEGDGLGAGSYSWDMIRN